MSALRALLDAQQFVTRTLSLAEMPARIVQSACDVSGAAYSGLLLLGAEGEIVDWAQHGLSDDDLESLRSLAGPVSTGRGSITERVAQLAAVGLQCLPVVVRGERYAELYLPRSAALLAGHESPHAAHDVPAAKDVLAALVTMIGNALETAILHAAAESSKDWLAASGEIARSLLADRGADTLRDVVHRARHVADADYAALTLARTDGRLEVAVATGVGADDLQGRVMDPAMSEFGSAVARGRSLLVADLAEVMREGYDNVHRYGSLMMAPLVDAHGVRGSVVLVRTLGRAPFAARDLDLATIFADQIALALEMDDARSQSAWLTLLEDRHRIAQDLHDNVMQRLFATGVGLQSLAASPLPPDAARRLGRYVADLDETIDEIRSRVFGLRDDNGQQPSRTTTRFPYIANQDGL
ncbi:GAF domain-containing protein [Jatrophihabitans endophyticus]|uniref:sensor histidine kinase n=1 Tax=Jatrophihabitans endophyticus TaxID=1206085 RepID=UPI001A0D8D6E|nr:GAF domain-containing protein [Jatrophihabitans endophyticus]MBE7188269.1 GAF domain-containing protein [Jatrophihabitans endophyticus]